MKVTIPATFSGLPDVMLEARRWLVWRSIPQGDGRKPRKVPYYTDGTARSGKLDTPEDWSKLATFEDAQAAFAAGGQAGLGFALGPDGSGLVWQGIDLDGVGERPALHDVARSLPGWVEASPSRNGLHAIGYGRPFAALGSNASGVEAYCGGRFFTVTGDCYRNNTPVDIADYVEAELRPLHGAGGRGGTPMSACRPNVIVTPKLLIDLRDALGHIEADDYHTWTSIGHALKTLGDDGWELWHDWSNTSGSYDADEAEAKWVSFKPERTGHRAIFAEARRRGWQNPAAQAAKGQDLGGHTEEHLALAFARENEAALRYCAGWARWLTWDGVRWAADTTLLTTDHVRELCRRAAAALADPRAAAVLGQARTSNAVERLARSDRRLAASTEQWDADPWLLNTPGGVVNLRTGEVSPPNPALHLTKVTATAPGGICPTWRRFLEHVTRGDEELQGYLQRALGYALTGDTSEHALFFAYGTGANGKSVLIDTVASIMGDYHKTAPIETLTESVGERHTTDLAMLRGARLVTAVETEQGRKWAEARIKTLTGGDRISARFMRQDFFEYDPQFKLLVAGNHRPGLRSVDEAMRRRFHLVPFAVTIPERERDLKLKDKLRAEWPGILDWMIAGCQEWQRIGLAPPGAVRAATEAYMDAEDGVATWIEECCERDPQGFEPSSALFASWNRWAVAHGEHVGSSKALTQSLEGRSFKKKATRQARGIVGLRLKKASA